MNTITLTPAGLAELLEILGKRHNVQQEKAHIELLGKVESLQRINDTYYEDFQRLWQLVNNKLGRPEGSSGSVELLLGHVRVIALGHRCELCLCAGSWTCEGGRFRCWAHAAPGEGWVEL